MAFEKKPTLTHYLYSKPVIILIIIAVAFLSRSVYDQFLVERETAARQAAALEELNKLNERREGLEENLDRLSEERGIEAEIRRNFDVARPGEQVVILTGKVPDSMATSALPPASLSTSSPTSWWQFWRR